MSLNLASLLRESATQYPDRDAIILGALMQRPARRA